MNKKGCVEAGNGEADSESPQEKDEGTTLARRQRKRPRQSFK